MTFQVAELRGYKSLRVLNAFHMVLMGMKMQPEYMGESYEDFIAKVGALPLEDQGKIIREAVQLVELEEAEVTACISFCTDPNGIPFGVTQLKSLEPGDIVNMLTAVFVEIAKFKIDFVNETEKKN